MNKYLLRLLYGAALLSVITLNSCATKENSFNVSGNVDSLDDDVTNDLFVYDDEPDQVEPETRQDSFGAADVAILTLFLMSGILNWSENVVDVLGTDSTAKESASKPVVDEADLAAKKIAEENAELYEQKVNDFIAIPSIRIYDIGLKELLKENNEHSTRRWGLFIDGKKVYIKVENGYTIDVTNFDGDGKRAIYKDLVNIPASNIEDTYDGLVLKHVIKDYVGTVYKAARKKLITMKAPKDGIYYTKMLFDAGYRFYNDFIKKREWFKDRR